MQHATFRTRASRPGIRPLFVLLAILLLACPGAPLQASDFSPNEVSSQQTMELYQNIPGLTSEQLAFGQAAIRKMNYNSQRIFRKLCTMPGTNFQQAQAAVEMLQRERFTFAQVQSFEAFADLPGMDSQTGMSGLQTVKELSYVSARAFRNYAGVEGVNARQALSIIPMIDKMDEIRCKAAEAMFAVKGMRVETAHKGLAILNRLRDNQAKAVETFARIADMDPETVLSGMEILARVGPDNAWNARCLFTNPEVSAKGAWNWLTGFFVLPTDAQEAQFDRLDSRQKSVLLKGLYDGGEEIVWQINNLHAVTDANGYEISEAELNSSSKQQLQARFDRLPASVRGRFGAQFAGASGGGAVGILRQATSAARVQTARDLTTANAYAVMAQGSELYDSSFREIMVPVMVERVRARSQGDLLAFLRALDPDNRLVSDFIVSCAQKGKLTDFFPSDGGKQKEILNLVASSAFRDEDSILLFSATLTHLLKMLAPDARSHLISLMVRETENAQATFARLIGVILQFYLQTSPELLGPTDRNLISRLLVRNGAVNMEKYQVTPFGEWKQDGRLGSVSMYHPDDDGRQSFISNGNLLLNSGYKLVPSKQYSVGGSGSVGGGADGLPALFRAMRHQHFAVAFVKQVGGVTITHTQFVYSDKRNQKEMLRRFIESKDEMLAQRGHSYWRSEQIVEPLEELVKEGLVTQADLRAKQRFLSLGSCGGVKAYTNLTRLFESSVDILATIGTGLALINDPYNKSFFEIIAANPSTISWKGVAQQTSFIFQGGRGQDYLQPGSLTAMLHKILDESQQASGKPATSRTARRQG